jgi:hydroxymethylpyrimidine pyrophosphatase-like HAD family hydrolase
LSQRIPISIATGREAADVLTFARQLGLTVPQICDGGATVLEPRTGAVIWNSSLVARHAEAIINRLDQLNTAFVATRPEGPATRVSEINDWRLTRISAMDINEPLADDSVAQFSSNPRVVSLSNRKG